MKISLLLIVGLVLGTGLMGAARATEASTCTHHSMKAHVQPMANTATSKHGVLATLAELTSEHHEQTAQSTTHNAEMDSSSQPAYQHRPGPAREAMQPAGNRHGRPQPGSASSVSASGDSAPSSPSADAEHPTLGWQSLLPGSIQ
jgi:hypothetical protein